MATSRRGLVITFNGEIYNFRELRVGAGGPRASIPLATDTEVVLTRSRNGATRHPRFNGMFAFAIWGASARAYARARPLRRQAPLTAAGTGDTLLFGSEVKAISRTRPAAAIETRGASSTSRSRTSSRDQTLFEGVRRCRPARLVIGRCRSARGLRRCWDFSSRPGRRPPSGDHRGARPAVHAGRQPSARQRCPGRQLLSGGIDSGSITALAAASSPIFMTFTVRFRLSSVSGLELGFDERARRSALQSVKTEHYEMVLHAGDMER